MRVGWVGAVVIAGLLGGCIGEPRIYLQPQPEASRVRLLPPVRSAAPAALPERPAERTVERTAERPSERPARTAAPLSAAEKERLFRQFEESRAAGTDP